MCIFNPATGQVCYHASSKVIMLIAFNVAVCYGIKYAGEDSCVYECSEMGWTEPPMDVIWRVHSGLFYCVNVDVV